MDEEEQEVSVVIDSGESGDFHSSKFFIHPDDEDCSEVADEIRITTTRSNKPETIDRGEEEEEFATIDFPESDSPEVELKPESSEVLPKTKTNDIKRDIGTFRYRDRFRYLPTTTTTTPARETSTRSLSINFDSESDGERVDLVTPAPGRVA